jgi:hypothetical protein
MNSRPAWGYVETASKGGGGEGEGKIEIKQMLRRIIYAFHFHVFF